MIASEDNELFYYLIRLSLGISKEHILIDKKDWADLYKNAERQALLGITFKGVSLQNKSSTGSCPRDLYLKWMAIAVKIQQRNCLMNEMCVEVYRKLSREGFDCCILKGQGIAREYEGELKTLRQSGDIDVLMWKNGVSLSECRQEILKVARKYDKSVVGSEHHVAVVMDGTEVEMHYAPAYMCNPFANRRFRKWFAAYDALRFVQCSGFVTPNADYNIVFLLAHSFRHYLGEGLGMRQVMDYYFVLRNYKRNNNSNNEIMRLLASFNMAGFAKAMMWVMKEVFDMPDSMLLCTPDVHRGKLLLHHIMNGGNFGVYRSGNRFMKHTHIGRFLSQLSYNLALAHLYPCEASWAPISMMYEFLRIRRIG